MDLEERPSSRTCARERGGMHGSEEGKVSLFPRMALLRLVYLLMENAGSALPRSVSPPNVVTVADENEELCGAGVRELRGFGVEIKVPGDYGKGQESVP